MKESDISLLVVKELIRRWPRTATTEDWKTWVANKAGVDLRFIASAVTKGEIVPPKGNLIDEIVKERSTDEESARKLRAEFEAMSPARQRLYGKTWKKVKRIKNPRKGK
jgi:hypothetical protein